MVPRRTASLLKPTTWLPEHDARQCPYKDLGRAQKRAIADAVRFAWKAVPAMAQKMGIDLRSANEDKFSMLLQNELNRILRDESEPVGAFTEEKFRFIDRGINVPDYTGQWTQKSPDLTIRPQAFPRGVVRPEMYGMFVECKLIDAEHPVRLYGAKGLRKFVDGSYAWMMPSAMMLAYVRDGSDPEGCLGPHLAKEDYEDEYGKPMPLKVREKALVPPVYESRHERKFKVGSHAPGHLHLAHMWLVVVV